MAVKTQNGHVSDALRFFSENNIYFGFGRKDTPWASNENEVGFIPPPPSRDTQELEEPMGFKLIESKQMVIPDEEGSIIYRDSRWSIVPANEAYTKGSKWVYLECFIRYEELPLMPYRQIAVFTRLEKNSDVPQGKLALLPEDVKKQGNLEIVDNRKPTPRHPDQRERISIIIEF